MNLTLVDGNPFEGEPLRITVRPQDAAGLRLVPVEGNPFKASVVEDVALSGGVGLAKGGIGLAGAGGDIGSMLEWGADKVGRFIRDKVSGPSDEPVIPGGTRAAFSAIPGLSNLAGPTSADIKKKVEGYTGEFRKPQTTQGRYAQTIGEFAPGALIPGGGGGAIARLLKFGALPGAASEAAGQAVEGSAAEPYIRGGVALATGGVASLATRPKTAATAVRDAVDGVTPQQLDAAENLFMQAQQAGQPITRAEALQYVTNGATRLGDTQRIVEGQGGMREFFAPRAAQNEAAFGPVVNSIDATPTNLPAGIGPQVGEAAGDAITGVRQAINAAAEPYYSASASTRIRPADMALVRNTPGWPEARDAVRNDPQLARYVQGLPDNSVGFINEVKKYLNQAGENAAGPMNVQRNQQRAAGYGSDAAVARQAGIDADSMYGMALGIEEQARRRYLDPLLQGPLGRIANEPTTKAAINALFPANPLANSADEITVAVTALAQRNPQAARALVRQHAEMTFNEATQNLISGQNQFGGAKFAAAIRGNPQQAANLEAAVRALPNGDQVWTGFDRFLQIVEAQGTRQRIGSQTAFNQEVLQDLRRGTAVQEAGTTVASLGFKWPQKAKDTLERWRLGRGVDEIATLLTNPEAARRFRQIAEMPAGARDAAGVAARLVYLAMQGANSTPNKKVSGSSDQPR